MFQLDYQRLIAMLLPFSLRKPFMLAWLNALLAPVKWLYMEFLKYRNMANYKMEHNGQVVSLQKVLNDRFDGDDKRIRIRDGSKYDWVYAFRADENKLQYLNKIYLYDHLSYGDTGADFQVYVPTDIPIWINSSLKAEFRSLLNYYKLAGKRYKLIKQ